MSHNPAPAFRNLPALLIIHRSLNTVFVTSQYPDLTGVHTKKIQGITVLINHDHNPVSVFNPLKTLPAFSSAPEKPATLIDIPALDSAAHMLLSGGNRSAVYHNWNFRAVFRYNSRDEDGQTSRY
jgi:hypothetical protein